MHHYTRRWYIDCGHENKRNKSISRGCSNERLDLKLFIYFSDRNTRIKQRLSMRLALSPSQPERLNC